VFPLPLLIDTQPSRRLRAALAVLHLAAAGSLLLADLPRPLQLGGGALLAASLAWQWRRQRPVRLRGRADGSLECWRGEAWRPLRLQSDSVALPALIVLRWREGKRRRSLVLLPDAVSHGEHRRLRLWLRWKARF